MGVILNGDQRKISNSVNQSLLNYCLNHSSIVPDDLADMRQAIIKQFPDTAHNIISVQTGQTLAMLSQLFQPQQILEIGTYAGYSALWLTYGSKAHLTTIDRSDQGLALAQDFWRQAGVGKRITFVHHDADQALRLLIEQGKKFDCFFIDASKKNLQKHVELCLNLRTDQRCLLIIDNVLGFRDHSVVGVEHKLIDKIKGFNQWLVEQTSMIVTMLPIGDGISICTLPAVRET